MKADARFLAFSAVSLLGLLLSALAPAVAGSTHTPPPRSAVPARSAARPPIRRIVKPITRPVAHPAPHSVGHPMPHPNEHSVHRNVRPIARPPHEIPRHLVFANPRHFRAWGWHGGAAWYPDHNYWGGLFWGPITLGFVVTTTEVVPVAPDSPGHEVLASYDLVETPCDDSIPQVDLYGPDGSMVCATPNSEVPAGRYNIDASTLSLAQTDEE